MAIAVCGDYLLLSTHMKDKPFSRHDSKKSQGAPGSHPYFVSSAQASSLSTSKRPGITFWLRSDPLSRLSPSDKLCTHTDTIENKASLGFLQHIALSVFTIHTKESKECSLLTDVTGQGEGRGVFTERFKCYKIFHIRIHHEQFIGVALEQHYGCIRGKPQARWGSITVFSSHFARPNLPSFDNNHLNLEIIF